MRDFSDPAMEARLNAFAGSQGFNAWFATETVGAGNGQTELLLPIRPEMTQHHGYVHGGCVSALADMASAWAGSTARGEDVVTSNFTIHFLAPAIGTHLRVHAKTVRAGRTTVTVEFTVHAEAEGREPKLCAAGMAGIAVLGKARAA